jgi:hypothetical protein
VHRDVSTGNILSCDGHAKLADLEYTKKVGDLKSRGHEMRTASECPITLSGKSLIASQQGTMNFMSIEVARQQFLFHPEPGTSSSELDKLASLTAQDVGTAPRAQASTDVRFFHNHLHDLESLWWIAVWVVFYNNFSQRRPSHDPPSLTLEDVQRQLKQAKTLFPSMLHSTLRRDGFQKSESFQEACETLPANKKAFCERLDALRRLLISHYSVIEAKYPESVDLSSSKDDIYDHFIRLFSSLRIAFHDFELEYIPELLARLSKEEKNPKRNRSESSTTVGPNPKR